MPAPLVPLAIAGGQALASYLSSRSKKNAQKMDPKTLAQLQQIFGVQAGRGNELFGQGSYFQKLFGQNLQDRYNQGFGTPEEVQRAGRDILPGVDDLISRRSGRLDEVGDLLRGVPGAAETTSGVSGAIDELGGAISRTADATDADIGGAFRRMGDLGEATQGAVVGDIQSSYGGAQDVLGNTYGDILRDVSGTYGGLTGDLGGTFEEARKNLELIRPGGEAAAARSSRAFAPLIRQTQERLRRSGVDPNSPEAANLLRQVGTARARATDDQFADAATAFSDRANQLALAEQAGRERLGLGRLGTRGDLLREQAGTDIGLRLGAGREFRDALRTDQDLRNAIESGRLNELLSNRNLTFDRTRDYLGQRANIPLLGRQLGLEDFQVRGDLLRELNEEDLNALNLKDFQTQRGAEQIGRNLDVRGGALSDMGSLGSDLLNKSLGYTGQGVDALRSGIQPQGDGGFWNYLGGMAAGASGLFGNKKQPFPTTLPRNTPVGSSPSIPGGYPFPNIPRSF